MAYLDVAPLMTSLRTTPEAFELSSEWLIHRPSQHCFYFKPDGGVQIRAECNCGSLAVRADQEHQLFESFRQWQSSYWRPLQINREFASHFAPPSRVRRLLISATGWLHDWLLRGSRTHGHHGRGFLAPAE